MHALLGGSPWVFLGLTVIMFGAFAWMLGQALAMTWRPVWQLAPYVLLLAAADRFMTFALFEGELFSASGFPISALMLGAVASAGYFATRAAKMVQQYPWLFERAGPFSWRARAGVALKPPAGPA
jgi:hypothetical protein